ncbi:NAD-dependent DNA ligase LigA [Candidatus Gracilibacteria bacterium]|nr:NAD-dependent DNA ligase LigA [Candidatus Gracilibacteria bacterium]
MQNSELLSLTTDFLARINNLKKEDIFTLREVIKSHNDLYHLLEKPIISDTEYDLLFHALARLEADHDMLDESSPTARLAVLASEQFQKVEHLYPMISLDNTYSLDDVADFEQRMRNVLKEKSPAVFPYFIQPKYDGLGLALIYRFGKLEQAVTRGSGVEGEDVTLGAFEIENIPKEIPSLRLIERMEVRGEVMMSRTVFQEVNRERLDRGEKLFANPRNAASGSLRQIDPLITRSRRLAFFAYSVPQIELSLDSRFQIGFYTELMNILASWGFKREDFPFSSVSGISELLSLIDRETKNRREYFDFDIDGMVLKFDDMTLWDDLGRTEHHPRYSIAYKFPAKQVRTRVNSISHSVGRTGTVTPVANLEAVDVGGVIVRRATLHNYDELLKKDVREGDFVFIMRAGEVIPEIVSVITEVRDGLEKEIQIPTYCPICDTLLSQDEGKVAIYCPSLHCPAKIQGQMEMFVSKQGLNIDGLGTKQIELFLEKGWITDFASIFSLSQFRDDFLELEGYKEKSIQNLFESIESSRKTTLDRIFTAIGIPNVGKKTGKQIAKKVMSSRGGGESILEAIFSLNEEMLLEVKDIGPETARAFIDYMSENREGVIKLLTEVTLEDTSKIPLSDIQNLPEDVLQNDILSKLSGKSFCVTGTFDSFSRDEIDDMIEINNGEVRTSVSSKLTYLIAGENAGSKRTKADECGVKIIDISEFLEMIM